MKLIRTRWEYILLIAEIYTFHLIGRVLERWVFTRNDHFFSLIFPLHPAEDKIYWLPTRFMLIVGVARMEEHISSTDNQ